MTDPAVLLGLQVQEDGIEILIEVKLTQEELPRRPSETGGWLGSLYCASILCRSTPLPYSRHAMPTVPSGWVIASIGWGVYARNSGE